MEWAGWAWAWAWAATQAPADRPVSGRCFARCASDPPSPKSASSDHGAMPPLDLCWCRCRSHTASASTSLCCSGPLAQARAQRQQQWERMSVTAPTSPQSAATFAAGSRSVANMTSSHQRTGRTDPMPVARNQAWLASVHPRVPQPGSSARPAARAVSPCAKGCAREHRRLAPTDSMHLPIPQLPQSAPARSRRVPTFRLVRVAVVSVCKYSGTGHGPRSLAL